MVSQRIEGCPDVAKSLQCSIPISPVLKKHFNSRATHPHWCRCRPSHECHKYISESLVFGGTTSSKSSGIWPNYLQQWPVLHVASTVWCKRHSTNVSLTLPYVKCSHLNTDDVIPIYVCLYCGSSLIASKWLYSGRRGLHNTF